MCQNQDQSNNVQASREGDVLLNAVGSKAAAAPSGEDSSTSIDLGGRGISWDIVPVSSKGMTVNSALTNFSPPIIASIHHVGSLILGEEYWGTNRFSVLDNVEGYNVDILPPVVPEIIGHPGYLLKNCGVDYTDEALNALPDLPPGGSL